MARVVWPRDHPNAEGLSRRAPRRAAPPKGRRAPAPQAPRGWEGCKSGAAHAQGGAARAVKCGARASPAANQKRGQRGRAARKGRGQLRQATLLSLMQAGGAEQCGATAAPGARPPEWLGGRGAWRAGPEALACHKVRGPPRLGRRRWARPAAACPGGPHGRRRGAAARRGVAAAGRRALERRGGRVRRRVESQSAAATRASAAAAVGAATCPFGFAQRGTEGPGQTRINRGCMQVCFVGPGGEAGARSGGCGWAIRGQGWWCG
ncbi:MAG: hypothetical protein J3K34DRAFT_425139 [Monoraphidium minutum]|nr:MAG: hypothetical protein J3K34DRAFT_425139 [Monoraphidium minutum]